MMWYNLSDLISYGGDTVVDVASLRAEMARYQVTQQELADYIGISRRTLSNKMKKGIFGSDEMEKIIEILKIDDPTSIFFASSVTYKVTENSCLESTERR